MSLSTGWCSLAEAQFKMHRYADSAVSCSQGMFTMLYITVVIQTTSRQYVTALMLLGQKKMFSI